MPCRTCHVKHISTNPHLSSWLRCVAMSLPAPHPDRTALVTGASSGIGEAIAKELASRGHNVTLVARSADRLEALADQLRGQGVRAEVLAADLSDRSARSELPGRVENLGLVVDVLVNNAGLSTMGPIATADPAGEANMIEVDVVAVADLCVRFVAGMVDRKRGSILNVASTAAFQPLPGQAGYGACKAFVLSYTRALAAELKASGVTVTALCPGPVETGFGEAAGIDHETASKALPEFMWVSAETVAKAGIDGLAAGRGVVIPGRANWVSAVAAHLTPKRVLVPLLAKQHPGLQ